MAYISHAVRNKDGGCSAALLGGACNVGHANTDYEAYHWSKKSNDGVTSYRCGSSVCPTASPDHCTASDHRKAAEDQKDEANVRYPAGEVSCQEDEDKNNAAEWELKKYRIESRPAVVIVISKYSRSPSNS